MGTCIAGYEVTVNNEQFDIYPENKDGETIKVRIHRINFHLKHNKSKIVVTFKRYRYRGEWRWGDSRAKGSCSELHVVREVARMLYANNVETAHKMLMDGLMGRKLVSVPA